VEAERAADGDDELPNLQRVGVAELRGDQVSGLGTQDGEVREGIGADDLDAERAPVGKGGAATAVRALDDVSGAQQIAVGGDRDRAPAPLRASSARSPLDLEIGHGGPQALGDGRHGARVGVERLGVGERLRSLCGRSPVGGALDESQAGHEPKLATPDASQC
jgi:hypothetical protein